MNNVMGGLSNIGGTVGNLGGGLGGMFGQAPAATAAGAGSVCAACRPSAACESFFPAQSVPHCDTSSRLRHAKADLDSIVSIVFALLGQPDARGRRCD